LVSPAESRIRPAWHQDRASDGERCNRRTLGYRLSFALAISSVVEGAFHLLRPTTLRIFRDGSKLRDIDAFDVPVRTRLHGEAFPACSWTHFVLIGQHEPAFDPSRTPFLAHLALGH